MGRKEFGNYLFGDIDVPALETFETPIQPYDDSRSLKLNVEHPVVRTLIGFLGSKLEEVRQEQARASREAHKTEQMRRLAQEADKIAEFLNKDFEHLREKLEHIRAAAASRGPAKSLFGGSGSGSSTDDSWANGTQERGILDSVEHQASKCPAQSARLPMIIATAGPTSAGDGIGRRNGMIPALPAVRRARQVRRSPCRRSGERDSRGRLVPTRRDQDCLAHRSGPKPDRVRRPEGL